MRFISLVLSSAALLGAAAVSLPTAADIAAAATAFAEPSPLALQGDRLRDVSFTVSGVEAVAGLEPIVPTAFIASLTFAENSDVIGPMLTRRDAGIPEPETNALLIAGLAAVAYVLRRRRPRATT